MTLINTNRSSSLYRSSQSFIVYHFLNKFISNVITTTKPPNLSDGSNELIQTMKTMDQAATICRAVVLSAAKIGKLDIDTTKLFLRIIIFFLCFSSLDFNGWWWCLQCVLWQLFNKNNLYTLPIIGGELIAIPTRRKKRRAWNVH